MKERITKKLSQNLTIRDLQIINQSHLHSGHMGDNGTGETHFEVIISAQDFVNKNKVQSHRLINDLLKDEFKNGLHALTIKII